MPLMQYCSGQLQSEAVAQVRVVVGNVNCGLLMAVTKFRRGKSGFDAPSIYLRMQKVTEILGMAWQKKHNNKCSFCQAVPRI